MSDFNPGNNTQQQQQAPQQNQQRPNTAGGNIFTGALDGLWNLGETAVATATSNKTLTEIKDLLDEAGARVSGDKARNALQTTIMSTEQLNAPAIIFIATKGNKAYYFISLIEAHGKEIAPIREQMQGQEWEVLRTAEANFDALYANQAEQTVRAWLDGNNMSSLEPVRVFYNVIPKSTDLNNVHEIGNFYDSALQAIQGRIFFDEVGAINGPLRASHLKPADAYGNPLPVELAFRTEIHPDAVVRSVTGETIHADFTITVEVRSTAQNQNTVHNTAGSMPLTRVRGYIDFGYRPQDGSMRKPWGNGAMVEPNYIPAIIITENSPLGLGSKIINNVTVQALGLFAVAGLAQNGRWMTIFNRDVKGGQNLGALGLESTALVGEGIGHKPKMLNISLAADSAKKGAFTPLEVLSMYCTEEVSIFWDISNVGADNWVQNMFAAGDDRLIAEELNMFSDGMFSKVVGGGSIPVQLPGVNPVSIDCGTLVDPNGKVRDVRSFTYLRMLEHSNADGGLMDVYDLARSPAASNDYMAYRLRRLISQVGSTTYTHKCTRVMINNDFINAGVAMLEALNFNVVTQGLFDLNHQGGRNATFRVGSQISNSKLFANRQVQQGYNVHGNFFTSNRMI